MGSIGCGFNSSSQYASFMLCLVLMFAVLVRECSSSYSVFYKIHVSVVNEISEQTELTIHCKSADDDLGEHKLGYNQDFHWSFRQNFWHSTLFWCSMWWTDSNGHLVQGSYDIYSISRDWDRCHNECKYPVRQDGIYAFFEKPDPKFNLVFPWPK
ncbi:Plant self-incompatibility S1 [Macleaya cordata]|uniref:S-protein homolog n=1 Tax=Macleaya cordata TaxID=56857 RepID=A0A200PUA3_MACCD|nr:Plant self-incompatibility S1 [Macleaya cordata]